MVGTLTLCPPYFSYEIFQFTSINSNKEMFDFIKNKLNLIKNDSEKLKTIYNILKNVV